MKELTQQEKEFFALLQLLASNGIRFSGTTD